MISINIRIVAAVAAVMFFCGCTAGVNPAGTVTVGTVVADTDSDIVTASDGGDVTAADTVVTAGGLDCAALAEAVYGATEFPPMNVLDDPADLRYFFSIEPDDVSDWYAAEQLLDGSLAKVIIVRAKPDRAAAVDTAVTKLYESIVNTADRYPVQAAAAGGTVHGGKNGIYYLICNADGKKAEQALLDNM